MQPLLQTTRTEVRSNSQHLLVLGGVLRQQLSVSNQLRAYHETKKEWLKLQEMEQPRYQHGIAVIGNFLFVVGGQVRELSQKIQAEVHDIHYYQLFCKKGIKTKRLCKSLKQNFSKEFSNERFFQMIFKNKFTFEFV